MRVRRTPPYMHTDSERALARGAAGAARARRMQQAG
eukprot:COSAG02_NODE_12559_length_1525_cov_56.949507_2_plen_35_part_01